MRVVHVSQWYIEDMGYQENYLPFEQRALGHDVHIVTADRVPEFAALGGDARFSDRKRPTGTTVVDGVSVHRLETRFEVKSIGQVVLRGLERTLVELDPDVVHAHNSLAFTTLQTLRACRNLDATVVIDDHLNHDNFLPITPPKRVYIGLMKVMYRRRLDRIQSFVPVTQSAKLLLQSLFEIPEEKLDLLHLGVDTNQFTPSDEERASMRRKLGFTDDEQVVVTSGKFYREREIDVLLRAFGRLDNHTERTLVLVGDGEKSHMEYLRGVVAEEGLESHVRFVGFAPHAELSAYYNAADVGVWPGHHSITVIEALATGLPAILPENEMYRPLLDEGAALGFPRGDHRALCERLQSLLDDSTRRSTLRERSVETANRVFSWKSLAERSLEIYGVRPGAVAGVH
jgi:glycosyltransferase involved in cell wall biosynthesis